MSCDEINFMQNFGEHSVVVYTYLWLQALTYDCTNVVSVWLPCNDLIHSVHKITLHKPFIYQLLTTYATRFNP